MEIREVAGKSPQQLEQLLKGIPFYKELQKKDPQQFQCVLSLSKLVELAPGETIMRRGEQGSWIYFLLKGRLSVYPDNSDECVNEIMPGELFGDLAMLSNYERRATVKVVPGGRPALVFATNFGQFGRLEDFHLISLSTKLLLFRMIVHGIRWKLELNRMEEPQHPLVKELMRQPLYAGPKESLEELQFLYQQAKQTADMLVSWNAEKSADKTLFIANSETDVPSGVVNYNR